MNSIKQQLYRFCLEYTEQRMQTARRAITDAEEASRSETKSSAGDKYETGRAMMQQEIDRNRGQLAETGKLKHILDQINPAMHSDKIQAGSLVITDAGNFYIAISAGQVCIDQQTYYTVSSASPVGIKLSGSKAGEAIDFNGRVFKITQVL